jgi:peptidoglycan/xylan/chitin deacetylase (PgdA/CDA1 family)
LNLHRVSPERNPYWAPMTPEAFSRLVGYLARTCDVVTFDKLATPHSATKPRVVLSFDDGCRDFIEYAVPILERHRVRANHNVIVESVATRQPPWIIRVVDALNAAAPSRVRSLTVPGFQPRLEGDDELSKARYGTRLTGYLKTLGPADRETMCGDVEALLNETDPRAWTAMMSGDDVKSIVPLHDLGSHSYSHEAMARLSDAEFTEDLDRCASFFEQLGQAMTIFAFPYGSYRSGQIEAAQARGVEHVLLVGERPTTISGGVHTRITMYGDSTAELRLRAMGHRTGRLPRSAE